MHVMDSKGGGWLGAMGAGCGRRGMANLPHGDACACTAARTKMAKSDIFLRPTNLCLPPSPQRVEYESKRWDLKSDDCASYPNTRTMPLHRRRHDCTANSSHHDCYMGCYGMRRAPTHPCSRHSPCPSRAHRRPSRAAAPRWPCDHTQPRSEGACQHTAHGRARRGERASMHAMESKGGGWLGAMG